MRNLHQTMPILITTMWLILELNGEHADLTIALFMSCCTSFRFYYEARTSLYMA